MISHQPVIDKIYLLAKDPYGVKYQFLINNWESMGLNHLKGSKAFVEYSNDKDNIYKNIEEGNQKFLVFFVQNFISWAKKY